jgi:hypothetical protein
MTIELSGGEKVLFELPSRQLNMPFRYLHTGHGNLTVTDWRIIFVPGWYFGTPPPVEIPLAEITYIDNPRIIWTSSAPIYIRTTYERCYSFDVRKKIGDQIVATVESIVRQLRPDRFLPESDPCSRRS